MRSRYKNTKHRYVKMFSVKRICAFVLSCCVLICGGILPKTDISAAEQSYDIQDGNTNEIKSLEITDILNPNSGLTYLNSREVINYSTNNKFKMYSPQLVIDGNKSTDYSSGLYYNNSTPENDWIQIEFPKIYSIYAVHITSLTGGVCFPYSFDIQISTDGSNWTTVVTKSDMSVNSKETVKCTFSMTRNAKYVRILSKKLKAQGSTSYYAQFSEIAVYNTNDENVALYSNGSRASASNPLNGDTFDYETFYNDTFDTGTGWVNITNEFAYSDFKAGRSTEAKSTEIANFKKISDKGVKILYRFTNAPSLSEVLADPDAAAENFIKAMEPRVIALKDYVTVWGIFGEINTTNNANAASYARVIEKVAARIKEIDPSAKINVATALLDYGWTRALFEAGLDDVIDIIGVHIYKDIWPVLSHPEVAGNYIQNGVELTNPTETYEDYTAEINAYKQLVAEYSPDTEVMVTEVSEPEGLLSDVQGENLILAKWLTRQYCVDRRLGLSGTFWFTIDPISAPRIVTTLVNNKGERTPAWYALRNYNQVFGGNVRKCSPARPIVTGDTENIMYDVYENDDEYLIPYWYSEAFSEDYEPGRINMDLSAFNSDDVTAVDLISGLTQKINLSDGVAFNLLLKDYVTVLKIKKKNNISAVWNCISNDEMFFRNGEKITVSMTDDLNCSSDGNGAVKIEWNNTASTEAQLVLQNSDIPKKVGHGVKAVTIDVYVPETENETKNTAVGTVLYGYAQQDGEVYLNGFYNRCQPRELKAGWQKIVFDTTNCSKLHYIIWENKTGAGTIYIDNVCVEYQSVNGVFDSFENYADDWDTDSTWSASVNTDKKYIKEGNSSMRIDVSNGEKYILKSNWLSCDGLNGKQIASIDGYEPKTFGLWVYNRGAKGMISPEIPNKQWCELDEGWNYVEWDILSEAESYWQWDKRHFNQMVFKCTQPGTIYLDAMYVGYENTRKIDCFENLENWLTSNIELNTNPEFIYEGSASGKIILAPNSGECEIASVLWNSGGLKLPETVNGPAKKVGMWIYGDGLGAKIKLRGDSAYAYDTDWITIDFNGWRYVNFDAPSNGYIYSMVIKNSGSSQSVFYIDSMRVENVESTEKFTVATPVIINKTTGGGVHKGDEFECSTEFSNNTDNVYPICVIIAVYDLQNRLIEANIKSGKIEDFAIGSISAEMTIPDDNLVVKGFVMDSIENIIPYTQNVQF